MELNPIKISKEATELIEHLKNKNLNTAEIMTICNSAAAILTSIIQTESLMVSISNLLQRK